jgi:hypothetical protein
VKTRGADHLRIRKDSRGPIDVPMWGLRVMVIVESGEDGTMTDDIPGT